jgi:hypothetical protein
MTSTFRVIFLASSVGQSAVREALRQVDLGPTSLIRKLARVAAVMHAYRNHLEYTSARVSQPDGACDLRRVSTATDQYNEVTFLYRLCVR